MLFQDPIPDQEKLLAKALPIHNVRGEDVLDCRHSIQLYKHTAELVAALGVLVCEYAVEEQKRLCLDVGVVDFNHIPQVFQQPLSHQQWNERWIKECEGRQAVSCRNLHVYWPVFRRLQQHFAEPGTQANRNPIVGSFHDSPDRITGHPRRPIVKGNKLHQTLQDLQRSQHISFEYKRQNSEQWSQSRGIQFMEQPILQQIRDRGNIHQFVEIWIFNTIHQDKKEFSVITIGEQLGKVAGKRLENLTTRKRPNGTDVDSNSNSPLLGKD
jgi:hypothetical protein